MPTGLRISLAATILLLGASRLNTAHAAPPPLSQSLNVGKPAHPVAFKVEADTKQLVINVAGQKRTIAVENVTDVSLESVAVDADGAVAVLRAKGDRGEVVAILGGRRGDQLLLSERSDFHGDPGERTRTLVEARDLQGKRSLVIGVKHEAVSLCGGHEALFERRSIDPANLTLTKAAAPSLTAADLQEVSARAIATPPPGVLGGLDAVSSSQADAAGPLTPATPRALVDRNPNTVWQSPGTRGEFAILRFGAKGFPIERVVLTPKPGAGSLPKSLWLLADAVTLHVTVPDDATGPVEITLPSATEARCVALVIDETRKVGEPVVIAELSVMTAIEREGGVERLVSLLVQDDPRVDDIASALGELGHEAALRVAARYAELSERGKRRALRVLLRHLDVPEAKAQVLDTARHDKALQETALAGLRAAAEPGRKGLRELAKEPTEVGDAAATWLSRELGEAQALLEALGADGGAARPSLREALVGVARRESAAFDTASQAFLAGQPNIGARVGLVMVLSRTGQHADRAAKLAEEALAEVSSFEDRYRLALSLEKAGASPPCNDWLEHTARNSTEWMLRHAAFTSLQARDPVRASQVAKGLATDAYPRVRALVLASLVNTPDRKVVEGRATEDGWPLVRRAAVQALSTHPESVPVLRLAVDDTSRRVRSAAVDALASLADREAWGLVQARLVAPGEWPEVHASAMRFARALCVQEAREPLLFALRHALRPDASEDDVKLGLEALRALHDLGGHASADALLVALRDGAPPGLVRVAKALPPPKCSPDATAKATP